jgi:hypothetical protein
MVSAAAFVYTLVAGAALLALWILARFAGFGPRTVAWAVAHVVIAVVLLHLLPLPFAIVEASGIPATLWVQMFGVALPLLVYGFLSGGWVTRAAIEMLR